MFHRRGYSIWLFQIKVFYGFRLKKRKRTVDQNIQKQQVQRQEWEITKIFDSETSRWSGGRWLVVELYLQEGEGRPWSIIQWEDIQKVKEGQGWDQLLDISKNRRNPVEYHEQHS